MRPSTRTPAPELQALPIDFYERPVLTVARELIGCTVEHGGTSGAIVETEAYHESEPACHAFVGLTPRTRTLFGAPGNAYVYRSYGVHALLNAVCEPEGVGAAVLIRALEPLAGIELMRARRGRSRRARPARRARDARAVADAELCSGPGKLAQALGISLELNGSSLAHGPIRIGPPADGWRGLVVVDGTRVGITHAVELRWRFCAAENRHVSRPRPLPAVGRGV